MVLVASQVDKGSIAYLLSTPIKRTTVVRTQALYLITAINHDVFNGAPCRNGSHTRFSRRSGYLFSRLYSA